MRETRQETEENIEKSTNRSIYLPALRGLRQSRGLSQRELGKLAEGSPGTVYRLENSLQGAYPQTVRKLAAALEVSPAELVQGGRLK